jgi:hypothetical protein
MNGKAAEGQTSTTAPLPSRWDGIEPLDLF